MKDRLSHLQQVQIDNDGFDTVELDDVTARGAAGPAAAAAAAAASGPEPHLDAVLQEAQQIRLQIRQIQSDVGELRDANRRSLNRTSHDDDDATGRDANAIGTDVRRRAEAALHRLHALNDLGGRLESLRGGSDPAARIARTQCRCLGGALREAMVGYGDAETSHRDACRRQIQRQMEVAGLDVGGRELEEMVEEEEEEGGAATVFGVQSEGGGRTARSALRRLESRHGELRDLEERIRAVQELFLDVAVLVEEQVPAVESIQDNVRNAEGAVQDGVFKLDRAVASDNSNPLRKLFCSCFPCFYN